MANPQPTDAHLRIAHSIVETVRHGKLRKSTRIRFLSIPDLIVQGIMPRFLPCDNPCSRAVRLGQDYLFHCESCDSAQPNPYYKSAYRKVRISTILRWQVWQRDNFTCQYCGKRELLTVDHIIPESKGGKTELNNLQTLCKSCNARKSTNA